MCPHRNGELALGSRIMLTIALTLLLMLRLAESAAAVVRITDDRGGNIGVYWLRYIWPFVMPAERRFEQAVHAATLLQQVNGHAKTPQERKRAEVREITAAGG